jgi:type II secretory pathway pseudopilin PulG
MSKRSGRGGFNLVEVVIVTIILAIFVLVLAMRLPRQLEDARRTTCQKNLMQIGVALLIYDQATGHLPVVPELGTEPSRQTSPLKALLEELSVPDLREISDPKDRPARKPGFVVREQLVPGFLCPSDPNATAQAFPAPVSYRATAGDTPDGRHGVFSPGRKMSLARVQAGDGVEFTAAFSERLVGTNRPSRAPANYAVVSAPITKDGCPPLDSAPWKGDAGASWYGSNWQSTLYQHAMRPNASPSCIADDQRSAEMGASSGHPGSVNVLILDGSVRSFTSTVDPRIWRRLATPDGSEDDAPSPH